MTEPACDTCNDTGEVVEQHGYGWPADPQLERSYPCPDCEDDLEFTITEVPMHPAHLAIVRRARIRRNLELAQMERRQRHLVIDMARELDARVEDALINGRVSFTPVPAPTPPFAIYRDYTGGDR